MQFSQLYGTQLDIELGSADRTQLFTTARRQKAVNDAMHNFERTVDCTPAYGTIAITMAGATAPPLTVVSAGGTGYSVNDVLTVVGGTSTTAAQYTVTAVNSGVITTISLTTGGSYTVLPANPVSTTGGTGSGATLTAYWKGTNEYDLVANFPNFIRLFKREEPSIKMVDASGNISYIQGDNFPRASVHELDTDAPGWRADLSSTPTRWYERRDTGKRYLGMDPPPLPATGWTWTILVPYLSLSTDMVADSDTPFTVGGNTFTDLAPYHQGLVHYAAGLLEALRKNYSGAQRQMGLYAGYVAQFATEERKAGPNQVRFKRNYYRDATRVSSRTVDPHRFP